MQNIEKYKYKYLSKNPLNLIKTIFPKFDHEEIELVISIEQENLNIKELSVYLDLIYRVDGNLSKDGLSQYSHFPKNQIKVSEIRFGSLEIVIREVLDSINAERIFFIWLVLKYLPKIANSILDIGIKYYEFQNKREDYLEKKDKRKLRRNLRQAITSDEDFNETDKKTKEKIINILEHLFSSSIKKLPAASRFTSKSVKSINLKPKK